jgi:hypothetical protein
MREVPFVRKADDLALATSHLAQSSSASRFTAGAAKFFILSQSDDRPEPSSLPAAALGEHRHRGLARGGVAVCCRAVFVLPKG